MAEVMIEVTDEMVVALQRGSGYGYAIAADSVRAGITAALALIDPVPDEVREARIVKSDWEFTRIMSGEDQDVPTNLYRSECGCHYYTYQQIIDAAVLEENEVEWS